MEMKEAVIEQIERETTYYALTRRINLTDADLELEPSRKWYWMIYKMKEENTNQLI